MTGMKGNNKGHNPLIMSYKIGLNIDWTLGELNEMNPNKMNTPMVFNPNDYTPEEAIELFRSRGMTDDTIIKMINSNTNEYLSDDTKFNYYIALGLTVESERFESVKKEVSGTAIIFNNGLEILLRGKKITTQTPNNKFINKSML